MSELRVSIVTPECPVVEAGFDQVLAPSVLGEVGILPMHKPMLASLREGLVGLQKGNEKTFYAVSGGFLEVSQDRVTILAETAEAASDIDPSAAASDLKEAVQALEALESGTPEYAVGEARVRRHRARVDAAKLA